MIKNRLIRGAIKQGSLSIFRWCRHFGMQGSNGN